MPNEYRYNQRSPMHWVASHILRYPLLPIAAVLGALLANVLLSAAMVLAGQAFDVITTLPSLAAATSLDPLSPLIWLTLLILASRVAQGLVSLVSSYGFEVMAQRMERDIREELYIRLLGKSQTFHNRQRVGDIMARATNDVQQINLMVNPGGGIIVDSMLTFLVPLGAIALLRLELLLIPGLFLVVFVFAIQRYTDELTPVSIALRRQFGLLNAGLSEAISGIEVVKAYAQEAQERDRFVANASAYRDFFVQEGRVRARYLPLLLFGIAYGLSFGHALWLFFQGSITTGEIIAFMSLLSLLRFPIFVSLFSFALVQLGLAGAERVLSLMQTQTELDENIGGIEQTMQGAITFDQVTFSYNGTPVLRDISFTASPGETIAIVGQTGSGKSTLTRLVNRIYDVNAGRVLIDGTDVRDWSLQSLRSQISVIEQDVFLFSRTIADNIAFGAAGQATRAQIEQAAHEAQAHDFIMSFPDGYDT
ncbi:MAG: ABC transporter ATP-binding protein, partial [Chloroflexaceae bacterium]|nr:ABC transporter ATP-binding protein [Chloroflexaceae bacterium]